jgi:dipeptidyl aminopeptidase/acylaminoacyl peptidase
MSVRNPRISGAVGALFGFWALGALAATPVLEGPPKRALTDPSSLASPSRDGAVPLAVADLHSIPEVMDAVWTPDGKTLILAANLSGRLNLWKLALSGGAPVRLTTSDDRQWGIQVAPDGGRVLFNQDRGGAEIFDLYMVPVAGGEPTNLTQTPEVSESGALYSADGKWLAFASRGKTEPSNNIAVMDLAGRQVRLLTHETSSEMQWSVAGFAPDNAQLYANRADVRGTVSTVWRIDVRTGKTEPVRVVDAPGYVSATAVSPAGDHLAVNVESARGLKQAALLELSSGKLRLLHDDEWEQRAGHFSPDGHRLLFVRQEDGRDVVMLHDVKTSVTSRLPLPEGINTDWFGKQPSFSPDGGKLLFPHQAGGTPVDYWTLDLASRAVSRVTQFLPASMAKAALPETSIVHYASADGTVISAVLWMPFNLARDGKAPAVVVPHGGPTGQTEDRFDITAAALASRGYLVIAPNPRGSTGYGRAFMEANRGDLGGGDLEDYVAATRFLVETGYVDKGRIGITGGSYGGYMTLIALGKTPEVWAAGVQLFGITNWFSIYERGSPVLRDYLQGLIGDPVKDKAVYEATSPLTYLKNYRAPLLSLQGDNDPRVPRYEAELVTETLQRLGRTVEARYYAAEGHGFFKRENQIDSVQRIVDWFDRYLKGGAAAAVPSAPAGSAHH